MIESLITSLILTIIIELSVSIIIGIRKKNDIITVIMVNVLTNPIVVFIANVVNMFRIVLLYWIVVAIMEITVVFVEGKIFSKILAFKKISGFKISFINNVISFGTGLILTGLISTTTTLNIGAASAFYPLSQEIMHLQNMEYNIKMESTNDAYKDIINGKADIIIATEPSDEQKEMIKNSNVDLEFQTIYLEPLVIFVSKDNSIDNLNIEEIQNIYYGNDLNWNTYQLEKNNGSQTCFESIVKNNELIGNHYEIDKMEKIIDRVALDKKGIGYAFYSYYSKMYKKDNVKIINVNEKNIRDADYPLLFEVYLIYRKDNYNENILKIINWIETKETKEFINSF